MGSKNVINFSYSKLVKIKSFRKSTLFYSISKTFEFLMLLEGIFRTFYDTVSSQNMNLKEFFLKKMTDASQTVTHILSCHHLKHKIISRFVTFRLKIASKKKISEKAKVFASKSVMSAQL